MLKLLRDPRFSLLAAGQAANGIGTWATLVAIWGYATYRFGVGPTELAWAGLGWGFPPVLLGPLAGVLIDHYGPRRVLIVADLFSAVVSIGLILVGSYGEVVFLAALHGIAKAFYLPAFDALAGRLVEKERLFTVNAILTAANDLSIVAGPLVAAVVIAAIGTQAVFAFDAATYLLGVLVVLPLRLRVVPAQARARVYREVAEGLRVAWTSPGARALLALGFALWLSFGTYMVLEPLYVRDVLGASVTTFALLQTAFGLGLVGVGLLLPRWQRWLTSVPALALVQLASGLAGGLYVVSQSVVVAFIGVTAWGAAVGLFGAPSRTLLIRQTPVQTHGRVMATWRQTSALAHLAPAIVAGPLALAVGVQPTLLGSAGLVVVVAVTVLLLVRRPLQRPRSVEAEAA